jgi:copper homeostasis protein
MEFKPSMELEICVDSVESAIAAQAGGAQRIELCSDLLEGGITPSAGLIHRVRKNVDLGVFVMVRPRGGDSFYTSHEFDTMKRDVIHAKDLGADGVVLGLLDNVGHVDVARTRELVELAHSMQVTFHRAFDMSADLEDSLERIVEAGAHRILTSGGRQSVAEGAECVARLIQQADGRVRIMAGGSIRQENIEKIASLTGAKEFHCSLRTQMDSPVSFRNVEVQLGTVANDEFARFTVLEEDVRRLRTALDRIERGVGQRVSGG